MSKEQRLKQGKIAYQTLCATFDDKKWSYSKNEEQLTIKCKVSGDDLPMFLVLTVNVQTQTVLLTSTLSVGVTSDRQDEIVKAVSMVNYALIHGGFDYDIKGGKITFRMAISYAGCLLSKRAMAYLIDVGSNTVDDYHSKLYMIAKDKMSLEELQKFIDS